tara:strand:+ start:224 stop:469 length:246 start_codon:yes stop_codon:yes gene_type:complete
MVELSDFNTMQQQNNGDVDVNVLVSLYNQKLAQASNQVILLEAKLQTLKKDFEEEERNLQQEIISLQEELLKLKKTKKTDT